MFPISILDDGDREFTIKLKRDYVDRYFRRSVYSGTPVSFDITINGDLIATVGSASYYEKWNLNSTNAQITKGGATVQNEKHLQEDIEIEPLWDGTNVDMTETIRGTLSTLK